MICNMEFVSKQFYFGTDIKNLEHSQNGYDVFIALSS
jgi:hypothetical protein